MKKKKVRERGAVQGVCVRAHHHIGQLAGLGEGLGLVKGMQLVSCSAAAISSGLTDI